MSDIIEEDHLLNDLWSFYFHDPYDVDWNLNSYKKIYDISTVEDFWNLHKLFSAKLTLGMFFIMREHIFPCWDDPLNKDGGCLCIKVLKQDVKEFWETMCVHLLGETLCTDFWENINGLSISPKKHFCILKVWLKTQDKKDPKDFNIPKGFYGDVIYKANSENIETQFVPVPPTVI
jgi:hypothetical protein